MFFEEISRLKKICVDEGEAFVTMALQLRKNKTTERGRLRIQKLFVDMTLQQLQVLEIRVPDSLSSSQLPRLVTPSKRVSDKTRRVSKIRRVSVKTCQLFTSRERVRMHSPQIYQKSRLRPAEENCRNHSGLNQLDIYQSEQNDGGRSSIQGRNRLSGCSHNSFTSSHSHLNSLVRLTRIANPMKRVSSWSVLGHKVQTRAKNHQMVRIRSKDWCATGLGFVSLVHILN
ncbi:hypothetical protein Mal48_17760 [Thalassoglobus polymorphus]|uniref:Uncharacterized protein n=1 Tax=Thalassoglobus polymorphus TaxID=2527994 RepID=A0A517QLN2_9PLAN|nr:hypothetical protein Mal48_17760 [Thalassoglobus polymorphus]